MSSIPPGAVRLVIPTAILWSTLVAIAGWMAHSAISIHDDVGRLELLVGQQESRVKLLEDRTFHVETIQIDDTARIARLEQALR